VSTAIWQLAPVFAGEVSGVDITEPLTKDDIAGIEVGMDRYAALVVHDQKLNDARH
jgi:alpha-ketoglutarate-dependent 2,4-dichlorophenoxyacetate dioxygenase